MKAPFTRVGHEKGGSIADRIFGHHSIVFKRIIYFEVVGLDHLTDVEAVVATSPFVMNTHADAVPIKAEEPGDP